MRCFLRSRPMSFLILFISHLLFYYHDSLTTTTTSHGTIFVSAFVNEYGNKIHERIIISNHNNNNCLLLYGTTSSSTDNNFLDYSFLGNSYDELPNIKEVVDTYDLSAAEALKRTKAHLYKLKKKEVQERERKLPNDEIENSYRRYLLQSAISLKQELITRKLPHNGTKPDMARRLANHDWLLKNNDSSDLLFLSSKLDGNSDVTDDNDGDIWMKRKVSLFRSDNDCNNVAQEDVEEEFSVSKRQLKTKNTAAKTFCALSLSEQASLVLNRDNYVTPTSIQKAAIPLLVDGESVILHAETGSGKTLAYLLPITEKLWKEYYNNGTLNNEEGINDYFSLILTPTIELAAQVAEIATVLSPTGTVRFLSHPSDLLKNDNTIEYKAHNYYENKDDNIKQIGDPPKLLIGSAEVIGCSLFGDEKLPTSPTSKSKARYFLKNIKTLVLDEVDELLNSQKTKGAKLEHEKPAAIISATVARYTLGRAQIVATSATVDIPLKRELSRVLGLSPQECPQVIVGAKKDNDKKDNEDGGYKADRKQKGITKTHTFTIPQTVKHYVIKTEPISYDNDNDNNHEDGPSLSAGKLLTTSYKVIRALSSVKSTKHRQPKILLVLTRGFGISTANAIGALKHFRCQPEPQSLLDALEISSPFSEINDDIGAVTGTDEMNLSDKRVPGSTASAESLFLQQEQLERFELSSKLKDRGYLFVTGEDTIRGLHFNGLDIIMIAGKPYGPDEYAHMSGRAGRTGNIGNVINIVHDTFAVKQQQKSLESMLNIKFENIQLKDVSRISLQ